MEKYSSDIRKQSFDFGWTFSRDNPPLINRYYGKWDSYKTTKSGFRCPESKSDYDDSGWTSVTLPHDFLVGEPYDPDELKMQGYVKRGTAWYRKNFEIDDNAKEKQILLCFGGIAGNSEIYINGSLIKRNFGSFNEIAVDITDYVHFGQPNSIAVFVDRRDVELWAYEGGGIYRHVWLYIKPHIHVEHNGVYVKTDFRNGKWTATAEIDIKNSDYSEHSYSLSCRAVSPKGNTVEFPSVSGFVPSMLEVKQIVSAVVDDAELWSPLEPNIYSFEVLLKSDLGDDKSVTCFGIRKIETDPNIGVLLNGKPTKIFGICLHQNFAGVGIAVGKTLNDYRLNKIKSMGANAIRLSHNTGSDEFFDWCDRNGMLVMDENRFFESSEENLDLLRKQIIRNRNHPSIIFWSLYNEEKIIRTDIGIKINKRLVTEVRKLDDTRLITAALVYGDQFEINGAAGTHDIVGFNYQLDTWERFHNEIPGKAFIGTENVASFSSRGEYITDKEKLICADTDEYHVFPFMTTRGTFEAFRNNPYCGGFFAWSAFDYRGETVPYEYPAVLSYFGYMDSCGFEKAAYWFYRAFLDNKPFVKLFVDRRNKKSGDTVNVLTVTNCDFVELKQNGISLGKKESNAYSQLKWDIPYSDSSLVAIGYSKNETVFDINEPACPSAKIILEPYATSVCNDGQDVIPVKVFTVDANGRYVPYSSSKIEFECPNGVFVAAANGDHTSHESEHVPSRNLHNGLCMAFVRAEKGGSNFKLKAISEGLESAECSFEIKK